MAESFTVIPSMKYIEQKQRFKIYMPDTLHEDLCNPHFKYYSGSNLADTKTEVLQVK